MVSPFRSIAPSGSAGPLGPRAAGSRLSRLGAVLLLAAVAHAAEPPVVPAGLNARYQLEIRPTKKVTAVYQVSLSAPDLHAEEWELMWPKAPDLPGQRITGGACRPQGLAITDHSPLHQPLWQVVISATSEQPADAVQITLTTTVELSSRKLIPRSGGRPPAVAPLPAGELKLFTRRTAWFDYDAPALVAWLAANKLKRGEREGEVDFARRGFLTLTRGFGYEYRERMDRSASHVCGAKRSDCGGMSSLFVAILRSQGIPARMRAGRWALSAKAGERVGTVNYFQEHVKAEFFAQGVGWVPVDVAAAILHDKSRAGLENFGHDRGDFITLHLDHDLTFDTRHFGEKTTALLQSACYWAAGRGSVRSAVMKEGWVVSPAK